MDIFGLLTMLGGLALFLYGMHATVWQKWQAAALNRF